MLWSLRRIKIMIKYLISVVGVFGACVLSFLLWTAMHIPGFDDVDTANEVAQDISTAYGQFLPRPQVDLTHTGKVIYTHPGSGANPHLVIYEVLLPIDQAHIAAAAQAAMSKYHARSVTIEFYERQNVTQYEGGGIRRGVEHLLATTHLGHLG